MLNLTWYCKTYNVSSYKQAIHVAKCLQVDETVNTTEKWYLHMKEQGVFSQVSVWTATIMLSINLLITFMINHLVYKMWIWCEKS